MCGGDPFEMLLNQDLFVSLDPIGLVAENHVECKDADPLPVRGEPMKRVPDRPEKENVPVGEPGQVDFLRFIIENFDEKVVNFVDKNSRDAILEQKEIADEKEFLRVKGAIEQRILDLLAESNSTQVPSAAFFRQIVGILATKYPFMFLADPKITVEGLTVRKFLRKGTGGLVGIASLPKVLRQKFSRIVEDRQGTVRVKKRDLSDGSSKSTEKKSNKKRKAYGIPNNKYYASGSEEQASFIEELKHAKSKEEKELLFSQHRNDVQHIFTTSTDMFSAIPGFFTDLVHARHHFEWLTEKKISQVIDEELPKMLRFLKAVLQHMCSTKEFHLNLEIAKLKGNELNGSIVPEYVCLLRQLTLEWHKNQGGLLRFPAEPEPLSPHIYCTQGAASVKFEVCAENKIIFADLNFNDAVAGFFYITFIGNLAYPAEGESVAIWLQRKVVGINDDGKS